MVSSPWHYQHLQQMGHPQSLHFLSFQDLAGNAQERASILGVSMMMGIVPILSRSVLSQRCTTVKILRYCQTETVFSTDQHCVSYVQVRGSVPCMYLSPNKRFTFFLNEMPILFIFFSILGTTRSSNIWTTNTDHPSTCLPAGF